MCTVGCKVDAASACESRVAHEVINDDAEEVAKAFGEIPIVIDDPVGKEF